MPSADQTFSTHDLRKAHQDFKRESNQKHKWDLGAVESVTRMGQNKTRPVRPENTPYNFNRRAEKAAVAALNSGPKVSSKRDCLESVGVSDDSSNSASDFDELPSPPADAGVMYSFDAARAPTQGSQILHAALAKAVEKFEERETDKLVKTEYDVLDSEGEVVKPAVGKKGKAKAKFETAADAEEDYEFV